MPEASRWSFLEDQRDAFAVVTRRMEVIYLNGPARGLVPEGWFGSRCWDVFPVWDRSCAQNCPAIQAVANGGDVFYCEEKLALGNGSPVVIGVAVMPLARALDDDAKGVLLMRPRPSERDEESFRHELLAETDTLLPVLLSLCGEEPVERS